MRWGGQEQEMPNLLTEQEFTERFTEAIRQHDLSPVGKDSLILELHYGDDEPILTLSLKDAYARYTVDPDNVSEILRPYVQDIGWTVSYPRYPSKKVYENTLPTLRNFFLHAPSEHELSEDGMSHKGPIVYDEVLKTASDFIVMQFNMYEGGLYTPLRKGDTLRCCPDVGLLAKLSLHNLAYLTENAGINATPLKFESLKAQSYMISLGDDRLKSSVAALSCIPPVMASLEETFRARHGLIAIMPATDQLIISVDSSEEAICELGVLAQQLIRRAPDPLSTLIWTFDEGNLKAVQALELEEVDEHGDS
jgi:hypothetical protein